MAYLEGPSTQYLRTLVPKATEGMFFGTRVLKYWVLGPSGLDPGGLDPGDFVSLAGADHVFDGCKAGLGGAILSAGRITDMNKEHLDRDIDIDVDADIEVFAYVDR